MVTLLSEFNSFGILKVGPPLSSRVNRKTKPTRFARVGWEEFQ
jgi:hypothetical protein